MTRSIRVLRRAQADLLEIRAYIARDRPAAADSIVADILDLLGTLRRFPDRGAVPRDARLRRMGYRYLVHGEYLIFYKVLRSHVRIYRVVHGRRQYKAVL
ncbi:MAG: type II toxin-antitoxin system RelE/ParE family toxin [Candidatus Binatia bacterium]